MKSNKQLPVNNPATQRGWLPATTGSGNVATSEGRVTPFERRLVRNFLEAMGGPSIAGVLWNGERLSLGDAGEHPAYRVHIRDRTALIKLLANPDLYFGDLYMEGRLDVEGDLPSFLDHAYRALDHAAENSGGVRRWTERLLTRGPRANSLSGSRSHIHHHYDIGNAFYQLWLDQAYMQYTCAYYPHDDATLEEAQIAKLEHVCRKLRLKPGETVVEAGCGWGGLARYMARQYGVKVRSYNISKAQLEYARARAHEAGLDDRIEYVEDDYRNIDGQYDAFVSIGMLEHVGQTNLPALGAVIKRALKPGGRGLLHSIGRNRPAPMNAWIEKRIFPGAYPPSLGEIVQIFEPTDLAVLDIENLRPHYARTLTHWLERFDSHHDTISHMFDEAFVRAWRLYLAGSIAAFNTGQLQLFQVLFTQADDTSSMPWTRSDIYA